MDEATLKETLIKEALYQAKFRGFMSGMLFTVGVMIAYDTYKGYQASAKHESHIPLINKKDDQD